MNQKQNKDATAPISEDSFSDLPVKFRPKAGRRAAMIRRRKPHKISMWDQLPSTDSGFWINDFVPIERKGSVRKGYEEIGKFYPSPPHGWFSNWTKSELERLEHTVGVNDRRFGTKRRRLNRTKKILQTLESTDSAWIPCNMAAEAARNQRKEFARFPP